MSSIVHIFLFTFFIFLLAACSRSHTSEYIHITRLKIMVEHEGQQKRIDQFNYDFETLRKRLEHKINQTQSFSGALGEEYLAMDHKIAYFVIKYRLGDGIESPFCIFDKANTQYCVKKWDEVFEFPEVNEVGEELDLPWDD